MQQSKQRSLLVLILLIIAGEAIFILPFVIPRIFRPTLLEVFDITNLQLGTYFSYYGIVAILSYLFGGPLADRFPARNLMSISLLLTAAGGLILSFWPTSIVLRNMYFWWGFTTIFLFWAAMIKATREWGGNNFQGRAFGFLEGGRGLTGAILGSIALALFAFMIPDGDMIENSMSRTKSYSGVLLLTSCIIVVIAVLVYSFIPKNIHDGDVRKTIPKVKDFLEIASMPVVWAQAVIIICAYVAYKGTDDFSLYANEVLNMSEVESAGFGTSAIWLRPLFAVIAGFVADRYRGEDTLMLCFVLMMLGCMSISSGTFSFSIGMTIMLFVASLIGIYGIRGIYFSVMKDSGIPLKATGMAVGIMSVLGYTPDIFMSPLMGYLLDNNPGEKGHQLVFATMASFATVGLLASYTLKRLNSNIARAASKNL